MESRKVGLWALVAAITSLLIWSALLPGSDISLYSSFYFKQSYLVHFLIYLIYSAVLLGAHGTDRKKIITVILWCSLFGLLTEVLQIGVPGRSLDVFDWVMNTAGGLAAPIIIGYKNTWSASDRLNEPGS